MNIVQLSLVCRVFCWAFLVMIPLSYLISQWPLGQSSEELLQDLPYAVQLDTVAPWQWLTAKALAFIPSLLLMAGIYYLLGLFRNVQTGECFSLRNVRALRFFSLYLALHALARFVVFTVNSLVLTANHPPGEHMLSITFGSQDVKLVFIALAIWVVALMLEKGEQLQQENQAFV